MLGRNMLSMSGLSLYRNAVQFGMNVVVAATVAPSAYGLVVFTTPFLVLLAMLTDLGVSSAIVRAPDLSSREAGAAWGVMTAAGAVAALALGLAAWPLERAVAMPGLAPVMTGMAGSMFLGVAAATPRALLERELRYGRIATVEAAAIAIAAVLAVFAAWLRAGVWALVIYNVVVQTIRAGAFGFIERRRATPRFAPAEIGPLVSFGGWVLVTNLLNFVARNSDNLLIGAWLGSAAVGVYGLAYQFMLAPLMAITWPTSGILLSTIRGEPRGSERAQRLVEGVLSATALIVLPAMAYLTFGLAWPVEALLSVKWAPVPAIVAWLAPAGALQAIASYNGALLLAAGKARAQFLLTVVTTALLLATFLIALPYGLMMLVRAYVAMITVTSTAFLVMIVTLTGLTWGRLARALGPAVVATGVALVAADALPGEPLGWPRWLLASLVYGIVVLGSYALLGLHLRETFHALKGTQAVTNR